MRAMAMLAAASLLCLTGCDRLRGGGAGNGANASGAANSAKAGENAAATAGGAGGKLNEGGGATPAGAGAVPLDRTFLLGRWTDDGDCSADAPTVIEFTQDGRFIAANGGEGLWRLEGDRLTMTGSASTGTIRLEPIDQNTMTVINPDGSLGRSTRC